MNSAIHYLKNVLGINSFATPLVFDLPRATPTPSAFSGAFLVHTPFAPTDVEREMIAKMLSAIEIRDAQFVDQDSLTTGETVSSSYGVSFGIQPPKEIKASWLELPAISQFISEPNKAKLNETKKSAWSKLKLFKQKMGEA